MQPWRVLVMRYGNIYHNGSVRRVKVYANLFMNHRIYPSFCLFATVPKGIQCDNKANIHKLTL